MTITEARAILLNPQFGNPEHLKAKRLIEEEEEADKWRAALKEKHVECWCCKGSGFISCSAACMHECPTCEGGDDLKLTPYILAGLKLYQLRDLGKELKVSIAA